MPVVGGDREVVDKTPLGAAVGWYRKRPSPTSVTVPLNGWVAVQVTLSSSGSETIVPNTTLPSPGSSWVTVSAGQSLAAPESTTGACRAVICSTDEWQGSVREPIPAGG